MRLLGILLCLIFLGASFAQNVTVTSTIREALSRAQDGDEIIIPSGVYTGPDNTNLTLYGRTLSFRSQSGNFSDVTIDCGGNVSAVLVYYQRTPVNYTGDPLPPGNATTALSFFGISFVNCATAFYLNATNTTGNNSVSFENTQFTNNLGVYGPRNRPGGGAIYAEGYFFFVNVSNSVFSQNVGEYGGAIYGANWATINVTGSWFTNNIANTSGGAIAVYSYTTLNVANTVFLSNKAKFGGGVATQFYTFAEITMSNFTANTGFFRGGGVYLSTAHTIVSSCYFTSNIANVGGGICSDLNAAIAFVSFCSFENNGGTGYGGAIAAISDGSFFLSDSLVTNNYAYAGGAAASYTSGYIVLTNVDVISNNASFGGAFYISDKSSIFVQSSDVGNNIAVNSGDTLYCLSSTMTFNDTTIQVPSGKNGDENGVKCDTLPGDTTWCILHAYDSGDFSKVCTDPPPVVVEKDLAGWKIALIVIGSVLGAVLIGFLVAYAISTRFEAPSFFQKLGGGAARDERSNTV